MRSVFKICLVNIRKNKLQNILTGIIFLLAALIFSTAVAMLNMTKEPFDKTFNGLNASHTLLYYNAEANHNADIHKFWDEQKEVRSTNLLNMAYLNGKPEMNGEIVDTYLIATEIPDKVITQDKLKIVEGEEKSAPEQNEVWLPTAFALDNKINVGDVIDIPGKDGICKYTVSAIVVDPHYSVGMNNPTRVWVREGEIQRNLSENPGYVLGIRYNEYSEDKELNLWKNFEEFLKGGFVGSKKEFSSLVTAYTSRYQNIGLVMIVLSVIIVLFTLITLSFTISNAIMNDYKIIGVYKSQGFSSKNVIWIYMLNYLILAFISVPIGILLSFPVINVLVKNMIHVLGMGDADFLFVPSILVTFLLFIFIIGIKSFTSARKAAKIKPSQAIRYGEPEQKRVKSARLKLEKLKIKSVEKMLAIKNMLSTKKQTLIIGFCALVTSIMFTFSYTCVGSYENALSDPGLIGWDWSELTITNSYKTKTTDDEIKELLLQEENVEGVVPLNILMNSSFEVAEGINKVVIGYAYDGDMDIVKVSNMEGRNPNAPGEISLSTALSEKLGVKVGDKVEAKVEGVRDEYVITGIFFTMNSGGYLFRIQEKGIPEVNMGIQKMFQVKLKEGVNVAEYAKDLEKRLGDTIVVQDNIVFVNDFFKNMMSLIQMIASLICILVIIVCFITVFNINAMDIFNMKKNFGIFKSFGMSTKQIKRIQIHKVSIITIAGSVLGILAGIGITDLLLKPILNSEGFTNFGIVINWGRLLVIIPICLVIIIISTLISSAKIKNITVRELVNE